MSRKVMVVLLELGTACATLLLVFREFFLARFETVAGNLGDNYFLIAILEHWRQAFRGNVSDFASPLFFAPEQGALGYSESMFLFAIPYAVARASGWDPFLSFQCVLILFKAIGFAAMYLLLKSYLSVRSWLALLGAVLFTIGNMYYISIGHAQLTAVAFVPVLCISVSEYYRQRERGVVWKATTFASVTAVLEALLLFTSFYIGWFTLFSAAFLALLGGIAHCIQSRAVLPLHKVRAALARMWRDVVLALIAFAITLLPFLYVYVPTLKRTGGRSFSDTLHFMATPADLFTTGPNISLQWIRPLVPEYSQRWLSLTEQSKGWPLLTVLTFVVITGLFVQRFAYTCLGRQRTDRDVVPVRLNSPLVFIGAVLGVGTILLWLLSLKYSAHSPWWFVFSFVPGASAIRVPPRLNLVLNCGVVVVTILGLEWLYRHKLTRNLLPWISALAFCLIVEQINTTKTHGITRSIENGILARVQPTPPYCKVFYVSDVGHPSHPPFTANINAMLIASERHIPTINGYSGWLPMGWNLLSVGPSYVKDAKHWAYDHGLHEGLCSLSLASGMWTLVNGNASNSYVLGQIVDFTTGGGADAFKTSGWGDAEPGGSWTLGERSDLVLNLTDLPSSDLELNLEGHAFVTEKRPLLNLALVVNGAKLVDWIIAHDNPTASLKLPIPKELVASRTIRITIVNQNPISPFDLGLSTDGRKLGLAVHNIKLTTVH